MEHFSQQINMYSGRKGGYIFSHKCFSGRKGGLYKPIIFSIWAMCLSYLYFLIFLNSFFSHFKGIFVHFFKGFFHFFKVFSFLPKVCIKGLIL